MYFIASGLVLFVALLEDLFIYSAPDDRKMMQWIPLPEEIVSQTVLQSCAAVQGPITVTLWDPMT